MELHAELLEPLLFGLSVDDKTDILRRIERAQHDQLDRKMHPPRRRRRDEDGVLRMPTQLV